MAELPEVPVLGDGDQLHADDHEHQSRLDDRVARRDGEAGGQHRPAEVLHRLADSSPYRAAYPDPVALAPGGPDAEHEVDQDDHGGDDEVRQHPLERLLEKQQQCGRYARADHDTPRGGLAREDVGVESVHHSEFLILMLMSLILKIFFWGKLCQSNSCLVLPRYYNSSLSSM